MDYGVVVTEMFPAVSASGAAVPTFGFGGCTVVHS